MMYNHKFLKVAVLMYSDKAVKVINLWCTAVKAVMLDLQTYKMVVKM